MKALICGAGIGGLGLAWHLERAGWEVELLERAPAFRSGGYLIDFFGPGYEVAQDMGLKDRMQELRYAYTSLDNLDSDGRRTSGLELGADTDVVSLLRGDLAGVIQEDVGAPVRYGTSVEAVHDLGDRVAVDLTDGTHREVDMLVGADGVGSRVRELVFGTKERFLRYLGYHVAAFLVDDDALSGALPQRYQLATAPGRMVAAYTLRDGQAAGLFLRRDPEPGVPEDPASVLRKSFGDFGWVVPDLLRQCPQPPELYYDPAVQVTMPRWSSGRVVLLGDACHAVSLFAGHGASMALAGARILADELDGASDVTTAFERYQERLEPTILDTQKLGQRMVEWLAPTSRRRMLVRDWTMRIASLPGLRQLFIRSLSPGTHSLVLSRPRSPL